MNNSQKMWLTLGSIVLAIVLIVGIAKKMTTQAPNSSVPTNESSSNQAVTPPSTTPTPPTLKASLYQGTSSLKYEDALRAYSASRFQFADCRNVAPISMVVKRGTKIMLDNRDDLAHTFGIAGTNYRISGYHFLLVGTPIAGTYTLMCDGVNSVRLQIEK